MQIVLSTSPKIRAVASPKGGFDIFFGEHRLPAASATIGPLPTGVHILTVQFMLPAIELGNAPEPPILSIVSNG